MARKSRKNIPQDPAPAVSTMFLSIQIWWNMTSIVMTIFPASVSHALSLLG